MNRNRMLLCVALGATIFAGSFTSLTPQASAVIVATPNQGWNATTLAEWNKFWATDVPNVIVTVAKQYGWSNANALWIGAYNNGLANWKLNGYAYVNGWHIAFFDGFVAYVKNAGLTGASLTAGTTAYTDYIKWHLDFAPAGYPIP